MKTVSSIPVLRYRPMASIVAGVLPTLFERQQLTIFQIIPSLLVFNLVANIK